MLMTGPLTFSKAQTKYAAYHRPLQDEIRVRFVFPAECEPVQHIVGRSRVDTLVRSFPKSVVDQSVPRHELLVFVVA